MQITTPNHPKTLNLVEQNNPEPQGPRAGRLRLRATVRDELAPRGKNGTQSFFVLGFGGV